MLLVAVIGRSAPAAVRAGLRAGIFSVAMCLGHYGWSIGVLGIGWGPHVAAWLAVAVTAAPVAGTAAWWATRRRGAPAGAVMAVLAAVVFSGGSIRRVWLYTVGHLDAVAVRPTQAVLEALIVVLIVLVLPRHTATRLWAAALLIPAWWLPDLVRQVVESVVG